MEMCSLQSPTVSCSSTPRNGFFVDNHHPFSNGQSVKLPNNKKYPDARKLKFVSFKAQASGTTRSSSVTVEAITQDIDSKDENLVFVAGATGKVGLRTVRELLKLGFKVRAGVRNVQRAENLVKSVEQLKLDEEIQPIKKLEIVECDLEKPDMIKPALGNASIVVCCIGASEKEIFDVTGPCRIDYRATKSLIDAATAAKANHFILVTSLGTNKFGFPAVILNLFWGVLIWKRKAEEALLASGIPYTIVRPGGMERPTDSYKETHNVTLSVEDTLFGGQVSNLQVAELIAYMAKNRSPSYCKVVEVIAETTAPLTPFGELLEKIPSQRVEVYKPKEPVAAEVPKPSSSTETEPTPSKETATRPLSPYEDLKPPTSPCPTPSGPKEIANNVTKVEAVIVVDKDPPPTTNYCHSPYPAYNDFKPPTSPSPSPPITKLVSTSPSTKAEAAIVIDKDPLPTTNYCHSPFPAYNDFKPPTSPSPSSPIIKLVTISPSNVAPQIADVSGNGAAQSASNAPQTRPLSPFAMYEDMKPPTSPSPSSPNR